ncbi:hypothetical protein ACFPYI_15055 [Halomarina salina]|uniref:DUF2357 domain-containing protein n=1 Tax=Halomarina salina TaxID=1872699 RepID=A0ABD5RQH7_9EURY|nr:hypothetical protein [Halomarina salina]
MRVETYGRYSQSDLGLDDEEWGALQHYIDTITTALEDEVTNARGVEGVEEAPPSIDSNEFNPGGWVGLFPGDVIVVASHLSTDEYEVLLQETQKWVEIIGATTFEAAFPLSPELLLDFRTQLAAYSKALIELSESLRNQRLPVEVQRTQNRGLEPQGRPLFGETMREAARGSQQVVSEEVKFSFDTVLNHLLVRFHIDLLTEMQALSESYAYYESAFASQVSYHEDFVNTGIPSRFVDKAVERDFTAPDVIAEARREASGSMAEIIDLWEAFQRDIGMELSLSRNLNTAVKPISKLYELWCLGILLDTLTEVCGRPPKSPESINREYRFGDGVRLHYNRSLGRFSQYFKDELGIRNGPGQPDFALEIDGEIAWIGDAKFKTEVRLADYRRFLAYVVDLLHPDKPSSILYASEESKGQKRVRDYDIDHIALRPNTRVKARSDLLNAFELLVG